eukprot:g5180.t1
MRSSKSAPGPKEVKKQDDAKSSHKTSAAGAAGSTSKKHAAAPEYSPQLAIPAPQKNLNRVANLLHGKSRPKDGLRPNTACVDFFGTPYPAVGFGCYKIDEKELQPLVAPERSGAKNSSTVWGNGYYSLVDSAAVYGNESAFKPVIAQAASDTAATKTEKWNRVAPLDRGKSGKDMGSVTIEYKQLAGPLFLQSKMWCNKHGYPRTMEAFNDSCKKTGLLSVRSGVGVQRAPMDAYLIHHPGPKTGWPLKNNPDGTPGMMPPDYAGKKTRQETWRALEDLYLDGRVKVIGVCNFSARQLKELLETCRITPMVHQFECHPLLPQTEIIALCLENGITPQAFASLGGSDKVTKDASQSLTLRPEVKAAAEMMKKSPAQVLLRWALQRGCMVLPKSRKTERAKENAEILDWELPPAAMAKINAMGAGKQERLTWKGVDPDTIK